MWLVIGCVWNVMKSKACVILSGGRLEKPLKYFTWQNGTYLFSLRFQNLLNSWSFFSLDALILLLFLLCFDVIPETKIFDDSFESDCFILGTFYLPVWTEVILKYLFSKSRSNNPESPKIALFYLYKQCQKSNEVATERESLAILFLDIVHETQLMSWSWLTKHFIFSGQSSDINLALLTFNGKL